MLVALDQCDKPGGAQSDEIRQKADELRKLLRGQGDVSAEQAWLDALAEGERETVAQRKDGPGGLTGAGAYHQAWVAACTEQAREERETIAFVKSGEDGEAVYTARKAKARSTKTRVDRVAAAKGDKMLPDVKAFEVQLIQMSKWNSSGLRT